MFKNSYQSGLLSIFYSCGSHPLALWDMEVNNGHIKRITDSEVNSLVLEIVSTNVATTYITCPPNNKYLGIKLPFLVMIVKNLKRYFSFEITILDDKNMRRRFRISNFQSTTKIKPFCTTMPIGLSGGWNQIQFNLSDFTRRAYGSQFIETLRVQVHANVRLRRIYFAERLYTEEELPQEYKLYLPLDKMGKKPKKETVVGPTAKPDTEAEVVVEPPLPQESEEPKLQAVSKKSVVAEAEAKKSTFGRKSSVAPPRTSIVTRQSTANMQEEKLADVEVLADERDAPESEVTDGGAAEEPDEGLGEAQVEPAEGTETEAEVEGMGEEALEAATEAPAEETAELPAEAEPAEEPVEATAAE